MKGGRDGHHEWLSIDCSTLLQGLISVLFVARVLVQDVQVTPEPRNDETKIELPEHLHLCEILLIHHSEAESLGIDPLPLLRAHLCFLILPTALAMMGLARGQAIDNGLPVDCN
jgi:hypothetical protein